MPGMAWANEPSFIIRARGETAGANGPLAVARRRSSEPSVIGGSAQPVPCDEQSIAPADRGFLLRLQKQALQYFLDNQMPSGLMLDRQSNHGHRRAHGLCSISATGMGLVALALASAPPYRMISVSDARLRIRAGLRAALELLPQDHGVLPHFVDSASGAVHGSDHFSTVDTAWLIAGALWVGQFFHDHGLESLARRLYDRLDWRYWTGPASEEGSSCLIRHGKTANGRWLPCAWDRINGETAFMYVLGAGAAEDKALPASCWQTLAPFYGTIAGMRFNNADLGLFVFQYGLDLLDLDQWQAPGELDLVAEAQVAARANHQACRALADRHSTYRRYWGLSAGDGPGTGTVDAYESYAPGGPIDGTAHIMATLASIGLYPGGVLENLLEADRDQALAPYGRYGFSNVHLDRNWKSRDVVGIDAGAAILALDNCLMGNRVRTVFDSLPCIQRGLDRLGFVRKNQRETPFPLELREVS